MAATPHGMSAGDVPSTEAPPTLRSIDQHPAGFAPAPVVDVETATFRAILSEVRRHRRGASDEWCRQLAVAIQHEARTASVDPLLVAAIIAKESSFRSAVVSSVGAVGLMQLRPFVAESVAQEAASEWDGVATLEQPALNVRLGILYFKQLNNRFDGDDHVALTAYNRGPTRVRRQMRQCTYTGSQYAEQILTHYAQMRASLYQVS